MKQIYLVLCSVLLVSVGIAQTTNQWSGHMYKKPANNPCIAAKEKFYLEMVDENIDMDFSKWRSLMDVNAYFDQPVVVMGTLRTQTQPGKPGSMCKWIEVKEIHFDVNIPEKKKAVAFQTLTGYRPNKVDNNPQNDYQIILGQSDFDKYFSHMSGAAEPLDFKNNFVVAVTKSQRGVGEFLNPRFVMREKDRTLRFSFKTAAGKIPPPVGAAVAAIYLVDKVDYKTIVVEENDQVVRLLNTHWKTYTPPPASQKNISYETMKGYRTKAAVRQDGNSFHLIQTLREFENGIENAPLPATETRLVPNFVNEFLVVFSKTGKEQKELVLQDVTFEGRTIYVRYTTTITQAKMSFPTTMTHILKFRKFAFDNIIFEENGKQVGEITRTFGEMKYGK